MSRLTTGRVPGDQCLHAVTSTSPPYALCGSGIVVERVGIEFSPHDPLACPECSAIVDTGDEDDGRP